MSCAVPFAILLAIPPAPQDDPRAAQVAPFVTEATAAVLHLDLERLDVEAIAGRVLGGVLSDREIEVATAGLAGWAAGLRGAGATDLYLLIDPADQPGLPVAVAPLPVGADAGPIVRILQGRGDGPSLIAWPATATIHGAVVAGTEPALDRLRNAGPADRPALAAAFAAAGDAPATLLIVPSDDQRRIAEELLPTLPDAVGGGPITTVTQGARWVVVSLVAEPAPTLSLVVQSADADAAEDIARLARAGLGRLVAMLRADPETAALAGQLGEVEPKVEGDRLVLRVDLAAASELIGLPVRSALEASRRAQCTNNLKQIGLAMHNYHSAHDAFPPAYSAGPDGEPLLSWRVHVLPFLEQQSLYEQFHLDEPWDSPHNKELIARMPEVYRCPTASDLEPGTTTYLTPRGEATAFPGADGVTYKEITDGTSNTIMSVDAAPDRAVIWTRPDDWEAGEAVDPADLFANHPGGTVTLFCDGSVHFLADTIAPAVLRALTTRNGGEVISADDF